MLWFAVARQVWKVKTGHNSSFDPNLLKLDNLLVFPQLRNVCESVLVQLLQQQGYKEDYKHILQPFDKA